MKYILLTAFLVFLPVMAAAEEYTKEDFAFGYILETDAQGAIYSATIPHDVYTATVMNNLEDIRVFNNEGQAVPHEIRYPEAKNERLKISDPLPFFPLYSQNDQNDTELSMRIETGSSGEIVNIQKSSTASEETPSAYLIDMENAGTYPLRLNIQWTSERTGILVPVILESSEDLVSWRRVKKSTLADLVFMNNRLQHGEIELQRKHGRYLRLKAQNRDVLPEITVIQATTKPKSTTAERRWMQLSSKVYQKGNTTYLEAEIAGRLPIDALNIEFNQPNSLLKSRVLCLDTNDVWRFKGEGLFYLLNNNGNELRSEPLFFPRQNTSAMRLEIIENGVGSSLELTKMRVGYVPQEILFVARGGGPFTLAYGNGKMVDNTTRNKATFLKGLAEKGQQNLLRKAEVKEKVVLGGEALLEITQPKPWKKIILWLVLIAGVATLAIMAWSLSRKMNT